MILNAIYIHFIAYTLTAMSAIFSFVYFYFSPLNIRRNIWDENTQIKDVPEARISLAQETSFKNITKTILKKRDQKFIR